MIEWKISSFYAIFFLLFVHVFLSYCYTWPDGLIARKVLFSKVLNKNFSLLQRNLKTSPLATPLTAYTDLHLEPDIVKIRKNCRACGICFKHLSEINFLSEDHFISVISFRLKITFSLSLWPFCFLEDIYIHFIFIFTHIYIIVKHNKCSDMANCS